MPSYDYVKGTITSYEDLRSLAKRHRSLVVHNKEKRKTRVEYLAYEGRLAFVLGLRDPHCLVSSSDADKGDGGAYCQMCHTLVSPSSYDENTEVCVICSILSDAQKVVPKFPEGLSPPLFQEFKDSHSKKHRFDSYGLRWREQKSSAQDAQFLREWRKDKNTVRLVHYYLAEHFNKLRTNRKKEDDIELRYSQVSSSLFYVYMRCFTDESGAFTDMFGL